MRSAFPLPEEIEGICRCLNEAGHQAFVVGGAVRDLLLDGAPHDWDIATDASPERVEQLFPHTAPTGKRYGTITVLGDGAIPAVEVTTFRRDADYSDGRRPDRVVFSQSVQDDLARRDFTINALALNPATGDVIDCSGGRRDLARRAIRTVGDPTERFREDALRMMRAVRFATTLGFRLERRTQAAIRQNAAWIRNTSWERIRDEFVRITVAPAVARGCRLLLRTGLLPLILPEMAACAGCVQNEFHAFDVFEHSLRAAARVRPDPALRLAALWHDVGKPPAKSVDPDGRVHFYGHEKVSERLAAAMSERFRLANAVRERVLTLVRHHQYPFASEMTDAAFRRLVARVGREAFPDLIELVWADRMATGRIRPAAANRVRAELAWRFEALQAADQALSLRQLALNGRDVMELLGVDPGPVVGEALRFLLERVLDEPALNQRAPLERLLAVWWEERGGRRGSGPGGRAKGPGGDKGESWRS